MYAPFFHFLKFSLCVMIFGILVSCSSSSKYVSSETSAPPPPARPIRYVSETVQEAARELERIGGLTVSNGLAEYSMDLQQCRFRYRHNSKNSPTVEVWLTLLDETKTELDKDSSRFNFVCYSPGCIHVNGARFRAINSGQYFPVRNDMAAADYAMKQILRHCKSR